VGSECSLELVAFCDSDEVVGVPEIKLGEDPAFAHSIE
jgi:hypothetical protein